MIRVATVCEGAITRFLVDGTPPASEIVAAIKKHYHSVQDAAIWNFSDADISQYTDEEMRAVAKCASKNAHHKKTAYVGKDDLRFGLLRMYQTYAEIHNVPSIMKAFRDESEAIEWLQEELA